MLAIAVLCGHGARSQGSRGFAAEAGGGVCPADGSVLWSPSFPDRTVIYGVKLGGYGTLGVTAKSRR
jgi:hypothetical protein